MSRSLPHLGPQAREQIEQLLTLETLALIAGVLAAWFGAHVIGLGFLADALLLIAGLVAIGTAIFEGLDHLYQFAAEGLFANKTSDLDRAADHFAKAVTILGIEAVLAVLFRGRPKTYKGDRIKGLDRVQRPKKMPKLTGTRNPLYLGEPKGTSPNKLIGMGATYPTGKIFIYRPPPGLYPQAFIEGHRVQRRHAAYHEAVHRALTPRLNLLYRYRVERKQMSYRNSSFCRYLEELLAQTIAEVRMNGFKAVFRGVSFPIKNGYVTLLLRDAKKPQKGTPLLVEIRGFLAGNLLVHGMLFDIHHSNFQPPSEEVTP
ncbi:MAG: hypothetical protein ACR2QJ_01030 [Geminicoccaceae bacterium]